MRRIIRTYFAAKEDEEYHQESSEYRRQPPCEGQYDRRLAGAMDVQYVCLLSFFVLSVVLSMDGWREQYGAVFVVFAPGN